MSTPLHTAVENGDLEEVQRLLQTAGTEVDAVDEQWGTPLAVAIRLNHMEIGTELISAGARVDGIANGPSVLPAWSVPPLVLAAYCGRRNMIEYLLKKGADIDKSAPFLGSPLASAMQRNHWESATLLIAAGADVTIVERYSPLQYAVEFDQLDLVQMIIAAGGDVNEQANTTWEDDISETWTPLQWAAAKGNLRITNYLLAAGADPNIADAHHSTPLLIALGRYAHYSVAAIVESLVAAGADVLKTNRFRCTPLQVVYKSNDDMHEPSVFAYVQRVNVFIWKDASDIPRIASLLVAAGDRDWYYVPKPCAGIEHALLPVWMEAPGELRNLYRHFTEDVQKVVQECLRIFHRCLPEKNLRMLVLAAALTGMEIGTWRGACPRALNERRRQNQSEVVQHNAALMMIRNLGINRVTMDEAEDGQDAEAQNDNNQFRDGDWTPGSPGYYPASPGYSPASSIYRPESPTYDPPGYSDSDSDSEAFAALLVVGEDKESSEDEEERAESSDRVH